MKEEIGAYMQDPVYKPEQWITFEQGEAGGFGQIIGAAFGTDGSWYYTISGSQADGKNRAVREDEIRSTLQNGSWIAPSITGGGKVTAYTDA